MTECRNQLVTACYREPFYNLGKFQSLRLKESKQTKCGHMKVRSQGWWGLPHYPLLHGLFWSSPNFCMARKCKKLCFYRNVNLTMQIIQNTNYIFNMATTPCLRLCCWLFTNQAELLLKRHISSVQLVIWQFKRTMLGIFIHRLFLSLNRMHWDLHSYIH